MRKIAWFIAGLALAWTFSLSAQSEEYDGSSFARLTYVKGEASVARAGDLGTEEATVNLALVEGDTISVRDGRAEIDIGRKNFLRLDRGTEVEFSNLPRANDDRTRLHLLSGRIYLRINSLDQEKNIEVHSPDASYYVLEEGLFRFDVRPSAETELTVVEGSIEAAGEGGSRLISSRERLVASSGRLGSQGAFSSGRDDFDSFNEARDSQYSQYVSDRYLPAELSDYEEELADGGTWVYEQPYGYVWSPRIYYSDWRPYYYGHWTWYASCGWTWIPEETWGWPVYHYGRWHWRLGLGWYWIPQRAWGPAWVHWYHGADYFGWCPLSWYNSPSVLVDNYFYDRYHGSLFPGHNRAMTVVHRNQLQDRHISRVALSRQAASGLGRISLAGRQPDVRPVVSRSGLRGPGSLANSGRTQIRSFERTLDRNSLGSSSRAAGRPASGSRPAGSLGRSQAPRTVSPGSLSGGRTTSGARSTVGSTSVGRSSAAPRSTDRSPSGKIQSSPRRTESPRSGVSSKANTERSSAGARTYAPSSRSAAPRAGAAAERRQEDRRYSPSASISRFGDSRRAGAALVSDRPSRTMDGVRQYRPSSGLTRRASGTSYRPADWPPSPYTADRLESRSAASGRSTSYSAGRSSAGRSFSTPGRSSSAAGRSYSAPSRSSSGSRSSVSSAGRSASGSGRSYSSSGRSSSSSGRSVSSPRSSSGSGSGRGLSSGSSRGGSRSASPSSRGSGGRVSRRG